MTKIEFKPRRKKGWPSHHLVINGVIREHDSVSNVGDKRASAAVYDHETADLLASEPIANLEQHFTTLTLPHEVDWNAHFDSVDFDFTNRNGGPTVAIELHPDFEQWANPYSIAEYADTVERVIKSRKRKGVSFFQDDELACNGFGLMCRIFSRNPVAGKEMERCVQLMKAVCEDAEKMLIAAARRNSLTTFFSFPPAIRTACEQYLLYFIQFLDDLGIKADAEIKEDAQRVLFSVTPADGKIALAQIRDALELYLSLPDIPDSTTSLSTRTDLASQQLNANIFHLKSQLMLAQATLAAKDATIEALQLSNFQYRQLIECAEEKQNDQEALIGEAVHVTKVETSGLRVDLPLMLRKLKRRFGWGKTS